MDEAGCGEFMFALLFGLTTAARRVTGENVYSVFSLLSNRYARTSSSFYILCERGRPYRCRRAAVVEKILSDCPARHPHQLATINNSRIKPRPYGRRVSCR